MRRFPYIKQNSIAEIVSTMESFLVAEMGFSFFLCADLLRVICYFRSDTKNDAMLDPDGARLKLYVLL